MSVFCGSCQKLGRSVLTLKSRSLKSQVLLHQRNYRAPSLSSIRSSLPSLSACQEIRFSNYHLSPRRTFSIHTKLYNVHDENFKKEQKGQVEVSDNKEDDGSVYVEELLLVEEADLTEEEKQTLKELEDEERKLRESFKGGLKLRDDNEDEDDYTVWNPGDSRGQRQRLAESVSEGHVPFENRKRIIQDVIDEMWNPIVEEEEEESSGEEVQYYPRGKTGVFDLGELVDLLKDEGADELVAIALPKEIDYADYMVIVTVMNDKQLIALATFVRKRFKMKERKKTDVLPFLDKKRSYKGWIALDLGNIILQVFTQDVRDYYDLETLWTVGPLFDDLTNAKDPEIIQILNSIV